MRIPMMSVRMQIKATNQCMGRVDLGFSRKYNTMFIFVSSVELTSVKKLIHYAKPPADSKMKYPY